MKGWRRPPRIPGTSFPVLCSLLSSVHRLSHSSQSLASDSSMTGTEVDGRIDAGRLPYYTASRPFTPVHAGGLYKRSMQVEGPPIRLSRTHEAAPQPDGRATPLRSNKTPVLRPTFFVNGRVVVAFVNSPACHPHNHERLQAGTFQFGVRDNGSRYVPASNA
jgi:hypothetical protein